MLYRPLKFVFFVILGVLPAVLGAQTPLLPATMPEDFFPGLRDILRTTLQQSPQMIAHDIDLATQEANRYQASSQEWPSIGGGVSYLDTKSKVSASGASATPSTSTQGFVYSLGASQPIYHWGALQAATEIDHLQIKISEKQYAEGYRGLATTIRAQYLGLIMQKVQLRNLRFALDMAKASQGVVETKFKSGAATATDKAYAQLAVDDASLMLDRATEDFGHAKRLFLLMTGLAELSDESIPAEIPKPVCSTDVIGALQQDFERTGVYETNSAQIYYDTIKVNNLSYKIAKYRLYPRVDLSAAVSEQNQTQIVGQIIYNNPVFSESLSLGANWALFDGFATRGAKLSALAGKRGAELGLQTYLDQSLVLSRYLKRQLEFSIRALALAEQRSSYVEGNLPTARENLRLGVGSRAELDQATASSYQIQTAVFNARIDFFQRWSEYLSLLGLDPVLNNLPAHFTNHAK